MLELNKIYQGDCLEVMQDIDSDSVDCVVTDPPYQLSSPNIKNVTKGFMGKSWDICPSIEIWQECLRVLKPGAFAFVMCIPRQDCLARMICRLEDAGFNISFSSVLHTFASGFPKAQNLGKKIDKRNGRTQKQYKELGSYLREARGNKLQKEISKHFLSKTGGLTGCVANWELGLNVPTKEQWEILKRELYLDNHFDELIEREEAKREVIGKDGRKAKESCFNIGVQDEWDITKPATPQAKALDGAYSGMQLKPAVEIVIVSMKPIEEKTYVDQALKNGHGCTWLDDCRIPYAGEENVETVTKKPSKLKKNAISYVRPDEPLYGGTGHQNGRFPANVLCEDDVLDDGRELISKWGKCVAGKEYMGRGIQKEWEAPRDSGSFSRYFSLDAWVAERIKQLPKEAQKTFPWLIVHKASKSEKNRGLENMEPKQVNDDRNELPDNAFQRGITYRTNTHSTVKPLKLMSWLITLASREGDTVLDPFCGSGTTAIAAKMLGRRYIGIEREEDYCEIARKRILSIPTQLDSYNVL